MTSSDEFVRWEDLDLGALLGDFTDMEDDVDGEEVSQQGTVRKPKSANYLCPEPECKRKFKSVSGFNGHVAKKHKRPDLKAAHNVAGFAIDTDVPITEIRNTSSSLIDMTKVFSEMTRQALMNIRSDSENLNSQSRYGKSMVDIVTAIEENGEDDFSWLISPFHAVVQSSSGIKTTVKREQLFQKFNKLCLNPDVRKTFSDFLYNTVHIKEQSARVEQFISLFLDELLDEFLRRQNEATIKNVNCSKEITVHDREIVHYISGYVLNKCLRGKNVSTEDKDTLNTFLQDQQSKENIPQKSWTEKLDRGGLRYPSKLACDFFLAAEGEIPKHIDINNVGPLSLKKEVLVEKVMASERVKRTWTLIVPGFCKKTHLCQTIINLMLTIRGFAIAKYVKRQAKENKSKGHKSASIRKSLKPVRV